MTEDRIIGEAMFHIHYAHGAEVDLETTIAQFTRKHRSRMQFIMSR